MVSPMRLSARNVLRGKVTDITEGAVVSKVKIDLGNGNIITAIISSEAVEDLLLKVGDEASAIIKATEVIVSKETPPTYLPPGK